MSEHQGCTEVNYSRNLMFHGVGKKYFLLCIVNLLLMIVTFGIYTPWAFVRAKKYLYSHTELSGARFSWHATGGSLFISWLFISVYLFVFTFSFRHHLTALMLCLAAIGIVFLPWLMVQGIRYQMQSTMLNNARFNFKCSGLKAWWVILGCPVLLFALVYFISLVCMSVGFSVISFNIQNVMTVIALAMAFTLLGVAVVQGLTTAMWLGLILNGLSFGQLKFSAAVSIRKCIQILLVAILILSPFLVAIVMMNYPWMMKFSLPAYAGGTEYTLAEAESIKSVVRISAVIYIIGAVLCSSYLYVTLRNYYFNTVVLSERIAFRSTLTLGGYIIQLAINTILTICTLGLGYPFARIRYCRYLAQNSWVDGDLDALDVQDHTDKMGADIVSRISCGLMPNINL